jgi:hypothetical protein
MNPILTRNYAGRPEDIELRLSCCLEDLIPEDEKVDQMDEDHNNNNALLLLLKSNKEIYQNIEQLQAKINLLNEQLEVNNSLIYHYCTHKWVNDGYDPGSGRSYKVCNICNLPGTSRYKY